MASGAFDALKEHVDNIWLVDTHEHLIVEDEWLAYDEGYIDFSWFFFHYVSINVVSAGMPKADLDRMVRCDVPLDEKWALLEPHWHKVQNTSYCKALKSAIEDIYGLPGLNKDTYKPLTQKMREMRKPGFYKHVIKDLSKIAICIHNRDMIDVDPELFLPVWIFDPYIMVRSRADLRDLENESGVDIYSLDELVEALTRTFKKRVDQGIIAAKTIISYCRTLAFEHPTKSDAERAFNYIFTERGQSRDDSIHSIPASQAKPLQDYMFHKLVQLCIEHDLPFQIHTGIHDDHGNYIAQSNPVHLTELLMRYPKARFVLFHAGYPYWGEMGILGMMFPNVHVDLCWTHLGVPTGARNALNEWLEVMPASKIFGFGGDYIFIEGVLPHAKLARYNVTKVLADKVDTNYFTLNEAKRLADMILHDNAKEFFRLDI